MSDIRDHSIYDIIYSRDEFVKRIVSLEAENAKLREQMEQLVTLLRNDYDIDASWDGLRKFWSIGLTEDGCLMRDRSCKTEAENSKLRELVLRLWDAALHPETFGDGTSLRQATRELGVEVK